MQDLGRSVMINFKNEILDAHNEYRKRHGSGPLKWSLKLESHAQQWANELARRGHLKHDCQSEEGENLACMTGAEFTGQKVSDMWYGEVKDYNFSNPGFSPMTGHFTQVIWAGSSELGVGKATAANGMQVVVARYLPAGNVLRHFVDNVKPISSCSTTCLPAPITCNPANNKTTTINTTTATTTNNSSSNNNNNNNNNKNETKITIATSSRTCSPSLTSEADNAADKDSRVSAGRQNDHGFQNAVLRTHNFYRKLHGAKPLRWCSLLQKAAQDAAEKAARTNFLTSVGMINVGENMAAMSGAELPGERVSEMWYEEEPNYNYSSPGFSTRTGSFTQLVWAGSKEFAVGRAFSEDGGTFVVALYQPPGNVRGQYEVNVVMPPKASA